MREEKKAPCMFPLPDGSRCCECETCHPLSLDEVREQWITYLRRRLEEETEAHDNLMALVRRVLLYPRYLCVGSIDNMVEIRLTKELYDHALAASGYQVTRHEDD